MLRRGHDYLCEVVKGATRLPPGHPEAFVEAFANAYASDAATVRSVEDSRQPDGIA